MKFDFSFFTTRVKIWQYRGDNKMVAITTRTAWAVFKYCGTKTVPLRMKKKIMKIMIKNLYQKNNQKRGKNQI